MFFHAQAAHTEVFNVLFFNSSDTDSSECFGRDIKFGFKSLISLFAIFKFKAGADTKNRPAQFIANFKHHQVWFVVRPARLDAQLLQFRGGKFSLTEFGLFAKPAHGVGADVARQS